MSSETPAAVENITQHYAHDGVIYIPKALSATTMSKALEAYEWSLEQPGPGASELPSKGDGVFYQDLANPAAFSAYSAIGSLRYSARPKHGSCTNKSSKRVAAVPGEHRGTRTHPTYPLPVAILP